jgi:thymidylate synthase
MYQYRELVSEVLSRGEPREWRNGHTGIGIFDARMVFDMQDGFPLEGLKKVPFGSQVVGEMCGFLRGYDNAADFRALGCTVWDQNANEEPSWLANPARKGVDDLGRIYGVQWRNTQELMIIPSSDIYDVHKASHYYGKGYTHELSNLPGDRLLIRRNIDQMNELIEGLIKDPHGRRHIVNAWNPSELHLMALPPCHMFFQCYVGNGGYLDMKMYQRSADVFLGIPFNIASYAALMYVIGHFAGLEPRRLIMDLGDTHLYTNQIEKSHEMLQRTCPELPTLELDTSGWANLDTVKPSDFALNGYRPHPPIKCEMAV